ncbi:beta strand repeat-containing protein [Faecalibacterium prausnitzii]|uniref:beta strand repeat-containing protein n=1 Tax=Faecalibacterium prausnitzii TaxID=853 RepID=UPI0026668600|nr:hypothetical protein [Faecalibacterium prausnitzii]
MKKRILSLILALSMVLSVFPLGAFAEGSNQDLVIGSDGYPVGSEGGSKDCNGGGNGNDWEYYSKSRILCLNGGTFDLSTTEPVECKISSAATITGGTFNGAVENIDGTISGGIFNGTVTNASTGKISGGTFAGSVENQGTIKNGSFEGQVTNDSNGEISGGTFQSTGSVTNEGTITGNGTFNGTVTNSRYIENGTFNGTVTNSRYIKNGTFNGTVTNNDAIHGGIFAGSVNNSEGCHIYGGVFNGKTGLDGVTVLISITVASGAKITEVNGVSAAWKPYVVVTSFTETREVIITADTEIFSLNGYPIDGSPYSSSYPDTTDKKTVKFTELGVLDNEMVLNGAITHGGDLVMENGYPKASIGGKYSCEGNGWEYDSSGKLILTSGTYDFSSTHPQGKTPGTPTTTPVACAVETQSDVEITGGTFNGTVENYGGTISSGTFKGTVQNWYGTISGGTFHEKVLNSNGEITGGTFAAGLSANHNTVTGGAFNGNTGLTGAFHVTVTNGSVDKVNGVVTTGTAWDLYAYEGTTMTITADTDIFSLNGQPISADKYGVDKKTVTFTMPDDKDVVLNKAIISTDLVMKGGYPEASNGGTIPCSGTGWSYDSSTKTLTLTDGTFDFNSTHPQGKTPGTSTTTPVACAIQSYATITGGIFAGSVTNDTEGMISGNGTFKGEVKNHNGTISGGKFEGTVINDVNGTISDGTFNKEVSNINGNISNGTFNETVTNDAGGTIYGGTFAGGVNNKNDRIYGGVFNGNATLTNVTGLHSITVASGAKIEKVNDVPADWNPYVVVTQWTTATAKEVTIIADTEIFSLNGQPIAESSYGVDKKTVTFTMPDDDVVLNKAITSTDLVMVNGYPKDSSGGKTPCKGDGWEYIPNDPTNGNMLLLTGSNQTGGLFDFSTIGDGSAVECNVFVGKPTAITGGEFNGKVFNNSGILGGTFHGEVDNMGPGRIVNGTFYGAVENNGIIEKGTFYGEVENNGTINDGAFHGKVENNSVINSGTFNSPVDNTTMGRIENGTFNDAVENNGTIEKGTFHDAVKNNGTINGGVFNGAVTGSGTVSESITGSGTLNGEPITKTEPEPEPEPTTYTVTVIGGTIDGKTSVSAKENDTLTVVLDQSDIPDGMTFDLWSISSSKLSGDINVDYRAEAMTFKMPAEDVTIRAQYRSAEIIEDAAPSPLATAATIAVGGAAAGIVVWQGVSLGVDLYLANALPQGVPVPTDRRALALLLWETAGKPEVALPTLYGDIPTEEIELQKATRWAVQNGLMDAADKKDASFFDPDHYVTKMDVFGAWLRLKKLLGTT